MRIGDSRSYSFLAKSFDGGAAGRTPAQVHRMPRFAAVCLFLLMCCLGPASAATNCTLVNLMPAYWQALDGVDPALAMRSKVIEPHPDLYNDNFVQIPVDSGWVTELTRERIYADAHRSSIDAAANYLADNVPRYMSEFQKTFPDFRCDFTFYIAPSFGHMDGSAGLVNGRHRIIFAPDVIPRLHELGQLKILIDHETFHVYHHQATGAFGVDEQAVPTIESALWSEGLATFVSWRLNPDVSLDEALLQPGIPEGARAHMSAITAELLADLGARNAAVYVRYFEGGKPRGGVPARAGYYVGLLIAQRLGRRFTLRQLAHLQGPQLHEFIVVELKRLGRSGTR
jgi:hypothetical protein